MVDDNLWPHIRILTFDCEVTKRECRAHVLVFLLDLARLMDTRRILASGEELV